MHIIVKFIILYHQNDKFYFFFLIGAVILERFVYRTRSNVLTQSFLLYDLLVVTFFLVFGYFHLDLCSERGLKQRVFLSLVLKYELIN